MVSKRLETASGWRWCYCSENELVSRLAALMIFSIRWLEGSSSSVFDRLLMISAAVLFFVGLSCWPAEDTFRLTKWSVRHPSNDGMRPKRITSYVSIHGERSTHWSLPIVLRRDEQCPIDVHICCRLEWAIEKVEDLDLWSHHAESEQCQAYQHTFAGKTIRSTCATLLSCSTVDQWIVSFCQSKRSVALVSRVSFFSYSEESCSCFSDSMIVRSHSLDGMSLNCSNVEEQRRAPTETIGIVKDVRITSLAYE